MVVKTGIGQITAHPTFDFDPPPLPPGGRTVSISEISVWNHRPLESMQSMTSPTRTRSLRRKERSCFLRVFSPAVAATSRGHVLVWDIGRERERGGVRWFG